MLQFNMGNVIAKAKLASPEQFLTFTYITNAFCLLEILGVLEIALD